MLAFDTYLEGARRRFAGLFGPGQGGQQFVAGLEFQPFVDKWVELGSKTPKKDMLAFDTYLDGTRRRFAGLFGPGQGGQQFVAGLAFQPFVDKWVQLGSMTPKKDLLAYRAYLEGGKLHFAGLFGPGNGGQEFLAKLDFDALVSHWVTAKSKGLRLLSVVVV
jgi:hypothetical protein